MKWVFWITIKKRQWFANFHKTRGANFIEFQFFKYAISIGAPWKKEYINQMKHFNGYIENTNAENLKQKLSFLMPCK